MEGICEICNSYGVQWILSNKFDKEIKYKVCTMCLTALTSYKLTRNQYYNIINNGHKREEYFLHGDFYEYEYDEIMIMDKKKNNEVKNNEVKKAFKVCFECLNCGDIFIKEYKKGVEIVDNDDCIIMSDVFFDDEVKLTCDTCGSTRTCIEKRIPLL